MTPRGYLTEYFASYTDTLLQTPPDPTRLNSRGFVSASWPDPRAEL